VALVPECWRHRSNWTPLGILPWIRNAGVNTVQRIGGAEVTRKQKQKRMEGIVARMQEYTRTYSDQAEYRDYSDRIFIDDFLYGIGIALDPKQYRGATGFDRFLDVLQERIEFNRPNPVVNASTVISTEGE
jgi:hypothetical protein